MSRDEAYWIFGYGSLINQWTDTIESINEATQLYLLAQAILGPPPPIVPPRAKPVLQTFQTLHERARVLPIQVLKKREVDVLPGLIRDRLVDVASPGAR